MAWTILVVDDSATVRQLIDLNLRKLPDVKVVQAVDGVDGLAKLREHKPAVVLTDINMPNMGGLELLAVRFIFAFAARRGPLIDERRIFARCRVAVVADEVHRLVVA